MTRTFRLAVLLGLFVFVGLAFPSVADAQRRGGGAGARAGAGARSGGAVQRGGAVVRRGAVQRGGTVQRGGAVVRGGGPYRGSNVAVPRTHAPYSSPYYQSHYSRSHYYRPYYYRPYYAGYYPYYYSPWAFSLSFGFGWYAAGYPYYAYPYRAYPYPYSYSPYAYPSSMPSPGSYQLEEQPTVARGDDRGEFGTLSLRVMPADATILIDGQAWDRPRDDERFSIELVAGPHQVEVRKAGYATYVRTIDVPRGRAIVWNVALTSGGTGAAQVARTVPLRR
jgi:hypothetical protein